MDFTKGWVGMNALQITSYRFRPHDIDDDFAMIDKGGGNSDLDFAIFSLLSFNNLLCLDSAPWTFMTEFLFSPHFKSDKIIEPIENNTDIFTTGIDLDLSATLLPKVKLPHFYPQNVFGQASFHWAHTMLPKSPLSN